MRFRSLCLGLMALIVAACGSTPKQAPLDESGYWSVQGRVGLWAHGEQESANFNWQDCNDRYRIRLSGPLGVGTTIIYGDAQQVSLHRGGDPEVTADSPEALLASLGWVMPVSALRYWLRGLPDPDAPHQQHPQEAGSATELTQYGWTIQYQPSSERAERITLESDNVRLKWMLRDWQANAQCNRP
ncbi:lipoprotein insertase outer membrane protein LolB [Litorivivens sp.]|uniref:lipoprotein insertase outer membrane protein LolB n=1 Tax=Litorivivens sp. TaxID=2020868 RepID=UPI003568B3C8